MPERLGQYVVYEERQERQDGDGRANLADKLGQTVKLDVQRCLDGRELCGLTRHLANFRLVANS